MQGMMGDPALAGTMTAGLRLPMIVAPMFLVSGPDLVIASARAGVIGALPSHNARSSETFGGWLERIDEAMDDLDARVPYAVNLVVHSSNTRLDADVERCVRHRVPIVMPAVGSPRRVLDAVKDYGGIVLSDVATTEQARRAAAAGADGLILLCAGAGGHTGSLSPFAFVAEVREFFAGPIVLGGAIARGRHLRAAEVIGADLAVVGTPFIAAAESLASDDYRAMLIAAGAADIVLSSEVSGHPANMLRESLERAGLAATAEQGFDFGGGDRKLKAWRDIWSAGHGVGSIDRVEPAAAIVDRFERDYRAVAAGA